MTKRFFVTGTDTEVGKTFTTQALLSALQARHTGCTVNGFKPLAAGAELIDGQWQNEDGIALQQASSSALNYSLVNPEVYPQAIAPHIAATLCQRPIDESNIDAALVQICECSDWLLVEGAGGWHVPFNAKRCFSDWVVAHQLPVILVVGVRLGCLSHALLTAQAIRASGLPLVGWIANHLSEPTEVSHDNVGYLKEAIDAPLLGVLPYSPGTVPAELAMYLDVCALD
ncbi:dethiobiotin synthase [Aliagarivorans taiwanensis]|uniref:dethiobiotin synthase n=1 Tax=Aliagarivorans taiwanensis TaxID=561966 RepID=UPI000420B1B5|nr:dethiobiotin synthase [Aliagarivorans taiwanensis]